MNSLPEVLLKTPLYKTFRSTGYPKLLPINFTILISTSCNSRCLSCNIWKQIHNDLSLSEWKKVLKSIGGSPFWFTISGGEPFLQPHLKHLAVSIDKICRPGVINIPTNSLKVEKIQRDVDFIASRVNSQLIINLSLDGVGDKHDYLRGVKGNFEKFVQNYKNLTKLKTKHKNLTVGIHSVISKNNVDHLPKLIDYAYSLKPDQYITEIAEERVELDTVGLDITPESKDYDKAIDYLLKKMKTDPQAGFSKITQSFREQYYQFVKDWRAGKEINITDYSGWASCEITSWGEVWPSCVSGITLGNVRKENFDFKKVWFSDRAKTIRHQIKDINTSFPLANAFYTNSLHNYHLLFQVFKNFLKP
jgi:MoaA/NifB/PqqE/SkfB family radical SAM enzyme